MAGTVDSSVLCDCNGGALTVTLYLIADGGSPTTFVVTNPYTGDTATIIVPPGEETAQTVNLLLASEWIIPVTVDGDEFDILLDGCCTDCLSDTDVILATPIVDTTYVVVNPTTGDETTVFIAAGDLPQTVTIAGLGPGTWTIHVLVNSIDDPRTVLIDPICSDTCPPLDIQGFVPCRAESVLGDGHDLRVLLMTKGGGAVLAELAVTSGNFTRELDATSQLTLEGVVTGRLGEVCCDGWEDIRPWGTEILVFRDGRDVWCGPVTDVQFDYGTVKVEADDLTAWWGRRVLPTLSYNGVDLAQIFLGVHNAAMDQDPTPNIVITVENVGLLGSRSVQGTQFVYAVDVLTELAKTSLDYTCYGRTVLVHGEELDENPWLVLMDDHWTQPPTVRHRGNDQATQVVVRGNGVQSTVTASAAYLDYYGLLTRTFDENEIKDQASCDLAAQSRLDLLKDALYIETPTGARLSTNCPITLPQLIPGMRVRVDTQATCRKLVSDFRLQKVTVDFNGSVSIDLQPIGTVDQLQQAEQGTTGISGGGG